MAVAPSSSAKVAAPVVTVIVPVRDGAATLAEQLDALARQTFAAPWELIVADNGSRDATRRIAEGYADRLPLRVLDASQRRGAAHARNVGAAAARAPLLAFVDADDVVADDWLAATVAALALHPVVVPRFDKSRLNSPDQQRHRDLAQERGLGTHNYAPFLPHAGGCGLALRRALHDAIAGFDVSLAQLEDTDYTWRLQLAGHALHYEPAAVVHVRFKTSLAGSVRQSFGYGLANGTLYDRYRDRGMGSVPLSRDLKHLAAGAIRLLRPGSAAERHRRLRGLANRLGIVIGRTGAAVRRCSPRKLGTRLAHRALARPLGVIVGARVARPLAALTFDDGPDPTTTPLILDALAVHGARATFFMVGRRAQLHPGLVARIVSAGHAVGSHTADHRSLVELDARGRATQIHEGARALEPHGSRLFRPPFGHLDLASYLAAKRHGLEVVAWSAHVGDWRDDGAAAFAARLRAAIRPGAIVLLHDAPQPGEPPERARHDLVAALSTVLAECAGAMRFVTVPELLAAGPALRRVRWRRPERPLGARRERPRRGTSRPPQAI